MMYSRLDGASFAINEHDMINAANSNSMASRKTLGGITASMQGQRGTAHAMSSNRNSMQQNNPYNMSVA